MIKYIILFTGLGFGLSLLISEAKTLFITFGVIALAWGFASAPIWGFVTLGELFLGYGAWMIFYGGSHEDK